MKQNHFVDTRIFLIKVLVSFLTFLGGLFFPEDQEPLAVSVSMNEKSPLFRSQLSLKFIPQLCRECLR